MISEIDYGKDNKSTTLTIVNPKYIEELEEENKQLKEDKRKAIEYIKITIKIIKEQPTGNDEWILERLNSFLEILGGSND